MPDPIVSRESIALDADYAALKWAAHPKAPKPANPYHEAVHPAHYRAWQASFERSLLAHTAPEAEASA